MSAPDTILIVDIADLLRSLWQNDRVAPIANHQAAVPIKIAAARSAADKYSSLGIFTPQPAYMPKTDANVAGFVRVIKNVDV